MQLHQKLSYWLFHEHVFIVLDIFKCLIIVAEMQYQITFYAVHENTILSTTGFYI